MSIVWRLADALGIVPHEPDVTMQRMAAGWWQQGRTFACSHAKSSPLWLVVWPLPNAWCADCGLRALDLIDRCLYCSLPVTPEDGEHVVYEPAEGYLAFIARAHLQCLKEAQ